MLSAGPSGPASDGESSRFALLKPLKPGWGNHWHKWNKRDWIFNLHELLAPCTPPHHIFLTRHALPVSPEKPQPRCRFCSYEVILESMPAIFVCFPGTHFVNFKRRGYGKECLISNGRSRTGQAAECWKETFTWWARFSLNSEWLTISEGLTAEFLWHCFGFIQIDILRGFLRVAGV